MLRDRRASRPTKALLLLSLPLALLASPALLPGGTTASAAASPGCHADDLPLRLVTGSSSMLTAAPARSTTSSAPAGFADRGVVALATTTAAPGTVPVTRYRSGSDYVYVTDTASRTAAEAAGYQADGETFRGSATPAPGCTQAVYQLERGASHQVAVGGTAVAALVRQGWQVQWLLFHAAEVPGRARPVADGRVARALPANDKDTTFGMVVLPDLQREVHTDADRRLLLRSRYIAGKQKSWDLRLAVSVGDIADWDSPDHAQYARAAQQLEPVVAAMPFVATPGNHDSAAVCPGGSACLGLKARIGLRDTTVYNQYFPASRFSLLRGQLEPGKVDNAYHTFRAGGVDWLVLNLELWPRPEVVDWAERVVAANPRKNVVIVTHSYLTKQGKVYGEAGGYGSTSPRLLQDRVVKRYPNVKIVLSGHTGKDAMRTDKGAKGNKVVSYLQCFHDTTGNPFRRLTINTKTGRIDSQLVTPSAGKKKTTKRVTGMTFVKPATS